MPDELSQGTEYLLIPTIKHLCELNINNDIQVGPWWGFNWERRIPWNDMLNRLFLL